MPGTPPKKDAYDLGSLPLPKDDDLREKIESGMDKIKGKNWDGACETLQALIGRAEDVFVPVTRKGADDAEVTAYVSVKKEAARLVATMPKAGRDIYETKYGEKAGTMVKQARTNNDFGQMAQAMSLYLYTDAGAEAANWLGTWMLDRAEFQGASRFFSILINRNGIEAVKDRTLVKAAYAFHQAGDAKARDTVFKELTRRGIEIRLRDDSRSVVELQESITRMAARVSWQSASDSPIYRGRPNRTAMLPAGTPFLERAWSQKMSSPLDEKTKTDPPSAEQVKRAEMALQTRNIPIYSAFVPVTATMTRGEKKIPLLIYRDYYGLRVVDVKTGERIWSAPSDWSLDGVLGASGKERDSNKIGAYTTWLNHFLQSNVRPQILFENSVLGTVSPTAGWSTRSRTCPSRRRRTCRCRSTRASAAPASAGART